MNIHVARPSIATTQAAEGLPRRRWTMADIQRMMDAGIITERDRFELIGGEIVPMSPKGITHENVKMELNRFWAKALPADISLLTETTLYISETDFLEPDFIFWPRSIPVGEVKPADIMLLVEAADSSLGYDLGRKAEIYASIGIREYWVVDARRLKVAVHTLRAGKAKTKRFRKPKQYKYTDLITPGLLPVLAVCFADLGLMPLMD